MMLQFHVWSYNGVRVLMHAWAPYGWSYATGFSRSIKVLE